MVHKKYVEVATSKSSGPLPQFGFLNANSSADIAYYCIVEILWVQTFCKSSKTCYKKMLNYDHTPYYLRSRH